MAGSQSSQKQESRVDFLGSRKRPPTMRHIYEAKPPASKPRAIAIATGQTIASRAANNAYQNTLQLRKQKKWVESNRENIFPRLSLLVTLKPPTPPTQPTNQPIARRGGAGRTHAPLLLGPFLFELEALRDLLLGLVFVRARELLHLPLEIRLRLEALGGRRLCRRVLLPSPTPPVLPGPGGSFHRTDGRFHSTEEGLGQGFQASRSNAPCCCVCRRFWSCRSRSDSSGPACTSLVIEK